MKKSAIPTILIVLLAAALPAYAGNRILKFMDILANPPSPLYFWPGFKVHIGWQLFGGTGQERMDVVALKNGQVYKTLASGMLNKYANMGQEDKNYWYNEYLWDPAPGDAGCHYQVRISIQNDPLNITSVNFDLYPALNYQKNGVYSYARLDTPKGGDTIFFGKNYDIKWTAMAAPAAWPSGKIHLKLLADINGSIIHVGDIATINIDFNACPINGKYTWVVGTLTNITHPGKKPDGTNGIKYRVRLTGDTSTYDTDDFLIGTFTMLHVIEKVKVKK